MNAAIAAIISYGYEGTGDGFYVRSKGGVARDAWKALPDESGFQRYTCVDGAWKPVPYTIAPDFEGVSGLTPERHPHCYEYVYPADYVAGIYGSTGEE